MENKKKHLDRKGLRIALYILLVIVFAGILAGSIIWYKINQDGYVKGVDVSAYQGNIDFKELKKQDIQFVYVKATEGVDHTDSQFENNFRNAKKAGLHTGAYHFVNFEQDGKSQAEHFINTVPNEKDSLPPVIDLELYGDYVTHPMDKDKVQAIVHDMLIRLEEYYGKTPVIYTNYNTYNTYLADAFAEIPIWICDVSDQTPELKGGHEWIFWQYSQRGLLDGYSDGDERFIDMNIYNGSYFDFIKQFGL